jgi:hypothetical protein
MKGVAVLASFSRQGAWAFEFALALAKRHQTRLSVYRILESPHAVRREEVYVDDKKQKTAFVTHELLAQKEKELREAFIEELGDFQDVAFYTCEGDDEWELNKHFKRSDYEVLVCGYEAKGASFGATQSIEDFASRFRGPLVLVGPNTKDTYYLNGKARERLPELGIPEDRLHELDR